MRNATAERKKTALFLDIDGTLIYSHKRKYGGDIIWAEYLNGNKQAFIPKEAFEFLCGLNIEIVPVTSRNPEQFSRLTDFMKRLGVKRALLNNGSLLVFIDGETDGRARRFNIETMKDCAPCAEGMERAFHIISAAAGVKNVCAALPCFISAAHGGAETLLTKLRRELRNCGLYLYNEKRRVYIMPEIITKGAQTKRFCEAFGIDRIICAGDSENDISMLENADICFYPSGLKDRFSPRGASFGCGGFFIDGIVDNLRRFS